MWALLNRSLWLLFLLSHQAVFGVRVLGMSIPKSGTHLLNKLIGKLGFRYQGMTTYTALTSSYPELFRIRDGHFFTPHLIASHDNIDAAKRGAFKVIFIYRDPRDQIISNAHYMKNAGAGLWVAADLPLDKLISKLIIDYSCMYYTKKKSLWNDIVLKNIGSVKNFYDLYKGWYDYPGVYITTFERLVGSKGGGSDEVQLQEINNIIQHLGVSLSENAIEQIQADLFGGTGVIFRTGQIGEWKKYFTEDDKNTFKEVAGQLLIDLGYEQDFNW